MVEKTDHLTQFFGSFGAYFMPQQLIWGSKGVPIYHHDLWNVSGNSRYLLSGDKTINIGQKLP